MTTLDVQTPRLDVRTSAVSWGAVFTGAFAAISTTLVLAFVGMGLGLLSISPWAPIGLQAASAGIFAAIWLVVSQWFSAALGGYLAGRLRTVDTALHTDEAFFRDTAHGFLAWAIATVAVAILATSLLGAIFGATTQIVSEVASTAATKAVAQQDADPSYFTDILLDDASQALDPASVQPAGTAAAQQTGERLAPGIAAARISRILLGAAGPDGLAPDDKNRLERIVASSTGVPMTEAQARVQKVVARMQELSDTVKTAAEKTRKAAMSGSLFGALSLIIGAFIASVAAALGGWLRDKDETIPQRYS